MPLPKAELDKIEREATGKQDAAERERTLRIERPPQAYASRALGYGGCEE